MDFSESYQYLLSLGNEVSAMKLGLENIRKLLAALDDPQNNYLKVQVAGTNGKGTVCAFLDSICVNAGIETGLYTSPHLVSITERIKVGGQGIVEADFARHATKVRALSEKLVAEGDLESTPTFFEQVTAIALNYFAHRKVELAILETGLGGRLDATTAANAEIVAITPIDIDHQEYLGESLTEIAAEKAATIRPYATVVIGEQKPEAMKVIEAVCVDFRVTPTLTREVGTTCDSGWLKFDTPKARYEMKNLGLAGRHQIENASVAILLAEELQDKFNITDENIVNGLQNARHPGRLEFQGNFLFDGAHNVAGARVLVEYLDEFIRRPITLVFGSMKGKDVSEIAAILFPKADRLILTRPDNSRAMTAAEIVEFVPNGFDQSRALLTETVEEALKLAGETLESNRLILITGSLYLVGEAKKILNN